MNQKRVNKWIVMIFASLLVIIALRLTWTHFLTTFDYVEKPIAVEGELDLRGWTFTDNQTLRLDGEWLFSPSQFFKAHDTQKNDGQQILQVPKQWDEAFLTEHLEGINEESPFRFGTYRLRILLDEDQHHTFAIQLKNTSAVYANEQLVAQSGQPATKIEDDLARNVPYTATLTPENGLIDLVIHTSSHAGTGGFIQPIRFGTVEAIQLRTLLSTALQLLLVVILMIHSVYAFLLYFVGLKNKGLVYFSLVMICGLLNVLVVDDKLLIVWLELGYESSMRLYYLSFIGALAFIPPLFHHMFATYLSKKKRNIMKSLKRPTPSRL